MSSEEDEIVWFHKVRNEQYHGGGASIPEQRALDGIRAAALEIFSILFEEKDPSSLLAEHIAMTRPSPPPPRRDIDDRLIDRQHDMIDVCGRAEYVSEVLYALDPERYREVALELAMGVNSPTSDGPNS